MFLYYFCMTALLVCTGPILLLSGKRRAGIWQKLGIVPPYIEGALAGKRRPVWFHAVSVGEFNAVWPLVLALHKEYPELPLVISTATETGQKLARQKAENLATVIYFPLDLLWSLNNWLTALKPACAVIVETEIWPGFTHECTRRSIPLLAVNARISPRSFRRYLSLRAFFGPVLRQFQVVVAQSQADADRYRQIAGEALKIEVSGNLKFDGLTPVDALTAASLRSQLHITDVDLVLVAGSTHSGEEAALLESYRTLSDQGTKHLRLILAPRHPERWDQVAALIESYGLQVRRATDKAHFESDKDVYLLDTIGQLFAYYSLATVAFVGGTLVPVGGHSLLEPYAYATPVVCGPHLDKTLDAAAALTAAGALTVVADRQQLTDKIDELLKNADLRHSLGLNGQSWLQTSQGATAKTLHILEEVLS